MRIIGYTVIGALAAGILGAPTGASAAVGLDPAASASLRSAVDAADLKPYLKRIEDISLHHGPAGMILPDKHVADGHGEYRLAGTVGDEQTVTYIAAELRRAGLNPVTTHFPFDYFRELAPSHFEKTLPAPATTFAEPADFTTMEYSGSGDITGQIVATNDVQIPPGAVAGSSSSGCEAADFTPAPSASAVALIQRGTCTFRQKVDNAAAAGYGAAVIFNEGQPGRTEAVNGTLGGTGVSIPVLGASFAVGDQLYQAARTSAVTVHVTTSTVSEQRQSHNVVASTPTGRTDRAVLAGAHTDSTVDGPAVNDDGTGVALLLGLAQAFKDQVVKPTNQVRFGFWGAEEAGLVGSAYYASQLSSAQAKDIAVNLAFDMLGSDNSARLVYDGDGSDTQTQGPNGSAVVENVFTSYYTALGLPTDPTALDGRTDYASFTDLGIPAGGITSGAEVSKTPAQQQRYGGVAGQPYYVCYHEACDTVATIFGTAGSLFQPAPLEPELQVFRNAGLGAASLTDQAGAAAHAVLTFAQTTSSVNGTDRASDLAKARARQEYQGSRLRK